EIRHRARHEDAAGRRLGPRARRRDLGGRSAAHHQVGQVLMPQFAYKAKKDDGSVVTGTLQAESERSALDSLGRMGVFPMEIESRAEDKSAARSSDAPRQVARSVRAGDVALFTRQLADLMRAGVPLNRALHTLGTQTTNLTLAETLRDLERQVAGGATLHEALSKYPKIFSNLYLSMVRAGEAGGFLE